MLIMLLLLQLVTLHDPLNCLQRERGEERVSTSRERFDKRRATSLVITYIAAESNLEKKRRAHGGDTCAIFHVRLSNNTFRSRARLQNARDAKARTPLLSRNICIARRIIETVSFVRAQSTSLTRDCTWVTFVYINRHSSTSGKRAEGRSQKSKGVAGTVRRAGPCYTSSIAGGPVASELPKGACGERKGEPEL